MAPKCLKNKLGSYRGQGLQRVDTQASDTTHLPYFTPFSIFHSQPHPLQTEVVATGTATPEPGLLPITATK